MRARRLPNRLNQAATERVLSTGKVVRLKAATGGAGRPAMQLKYLAAPAESPSLEFTISVPKRLLKRAVDRNAVKRQAREALRVDWRTLTVPPSAVALVCGLKQALSPRKSAARRAFRAELRQQLVSLAKSLEPRTVVGTPAGAQSREC